MKASKGLFCILTGAQLILAGCQSLSNRQTSPVGELTGATNPYQAYFPPALDPAMESFVQKYMDLRVPERAIFDAKNGRLFFSWAVTGTPQIWRMDAPGRFPQQLTAGQARNRPLAVTEDGSHLIFARDEQGAETPGLYRVNASGGEVTLLHRVPGAAVVFQFLDRVEPDWFYFRSNEINKKDFHLFRMNWRTGEKEAVLTESGVWSFQDQKDQRLFLVSRAVSSVTNEVFLFDRLSKALTPLFQQTENKFFDVRFGLADEEYFLATHAGEFVELFRQWRGIRTLFGPSEQGDVVQLSMSQARDVLVVAKNRNARTFVSVYDLKRGLTIKIPRAPEVVHMTPTHLSSSGEILTVQLSYSNRVPMIAQLGLRPPYKERIWIRTEPPELKNRDWQASQESTYLNREGIKIPYFFRIPRTPACTSKPCPVIIHFHGGPESQSTPEFSARAQAFVDAGFIYVEPNVRGSSGYGRSWIDKDNGPRRLKVINDIEDAASAMRQAFKVGDDVPRVGAIGASYGGYSALLTMTRFAGSFDAAVSISGMTHLGTFLRSTAVYRRELRRSEYGDPERDRVALNELSPLTHLPKLQGPLLMFQGALDPRVPVSEALQFAESIKAKKLPGALYIFPDEGHSITRRSNLVLELGHTLNFFKKHLAGQ